ncbi:putative helicase [Tetraselmis virus 1]|uniref:Putative helicase n=1 Tax=Tetraselmis virus 1 TaxID=2060617 RepID=A0A2P0VP17_9VIRU|nr:putative helicase [Tetraselmis virus 1]AUF82647.1 putative helicase [Tetraselmis virus 1]
MEVQTIKSDYDAVPGDQHPLLMPHQRHTLKAMWDLEKCCQKISIDERGDLDTNIGIYGDKAGSGKSYVLAEMMLKSTFIPPAVDMKIPITGNINLTITESHTDVKVVPISILIVPHNIVSQWTSVLKHMTNNNESLYKIASKNADMDKIRATLMECREGNDTVKIIMSSASLFTSVMDELKNFKMKVARIVFDEADNIRFKNGIYHQHLYDHYIPIQLARFQWLVTASMQNLFSGYYIGGSVKVNHSNGTVVHSASHRYPMCNSTHIRDMFRCYSRASQEYYKKIIVVTDNAFVDESFNLDSPETFTVECTAPVHTRVLSGIAPREVMQRLNAGDLMNAIAWMRPERADTENNIISVAINHLNVELENAKSEHEYAMRRHYSSQEVADIARERILARVRRAQNNIENVRKRIQEVTMCPICYDNITAKTVLPCCNNSFCLACITTWLSRSTGRKCCPMCKSPTSISKFMVCCEPSEIPERDTNLYEAGGVEFDRNSEKIDNLKKLLRSIKDSPDGATRKILFFSDNEYANENVAEPAMREIGINFGLLKGNIHCTNKRIRDFRSDGKTQALLINCSHYGCGLDLSQATDLILYHKVNPRMDHQVVGRAQRPPRSDKLKVWRFLHVDEET